MFNPDVFFEFETTDLRKKCLDDAVVANCGLTLDIIGNDPIEPVVTIGNQEPERQVYARQEYNQQEKDAIDDLIVLCSQRNIPVPATD